MRMLIVEDDTDDFLLIERAFHTYNVDLVRAESLAQAKKMLTSDATYDACLADLTLPDARNLVIIESLQRLLPKTPIFVLTGVEDPETKLAICNAGVAGWFEKGARTEAIRQAVRVTVALTALDLQEARAVVEFDRILALLQEVRQAAVRQGSEVSDLQRQIRALAASLDPPAWAASTPGPSGPPPDTKN